MSVYRVEFGGLLAVAAHAASVTPGLSATNSDKDAWAGASFGEAMEMLTHGWPEGAARAKALLDSIDLPTPTESVSCGTLYDVQGSFVDVGEFVQGTPECMVDFREDKRTARFFHITVEGFYSSGVRISQAIARGVRIAAIVDALESRGVRCSVDYLMRGSGRGGHELQIAVPLKASTDALNLDVLTFAVAHPAMFRRIMFAVMEQLPDGMAARFGATESGYYCLPPRGFDDSKTRINASSATFPSMVYGEDNSPEATRKLITSILEKVLKG